MATKKAANGNGAKLQGFVKEQVVEAQKRIAALEAEAQQVLENLIDRGQKSRKELEKLLRKLSPEQLKELNPLDKEQVKKLSKRATEATNEVRRRVEEIQTKVVESVGVASQAQVQQINKELSRLSKKLDTLVGKKAGSRAEPRS